MLRIALVANTFQEAKQFVEYKFKDKFDHIKLSTATYYLKNGDEIHLCYDEQSKDRYKSFEYDAIIIHPLYESLLDIIKHRTQR